MGPFIKEEHLGVRFTSWVTVGSKKINNIKISYVNFCEILSSMSRKRFPKHSQHAFRTVFDLSSTRLLQVAVVLQVTRPHARMHHGQVHDLLPEAVGRPRDEGSVSTQPSKKRSACPLQDKSI